MVTFEDIKPGVHLRGFDAGGIAEIVSVSKFGNDAINLVFRVNGKVAERLVYRGEETAFEFIRAGRAYAFDADGSLLRLASEAYRIRLAHLFDPYLAVSASQIEALPHQITAVYGEMLPRQPLRFLLADDPGAGKTIMAGLLIKELMIRGDLDRCLIVAPGSLVEQWQEEMAEKFGLGFDLLTRDQIEASITGNPFVEKNRLIMRLDMAARSDELKAKLAAAPDWDLIICDEAHRMAASYFGGEVKETQRHKLGKLLGTRTRNLLLMSATPHNGKEADFQLFMGLLDADRFEGRFREGVHKADVSDMMRRLTKEELYRFDGTPLFPERRAYTASYALSPVEADLYQAVTTYVREEMNAAEFPPEAKEQRYLELLRLSYPIHPELFDRLSKDWASLEKFQRTRGVLRFMANVVGVLWHSQTHDPLITPARVPVAHERVRASVLYPLDPQFGSVVDKEVDGDGSLPSRMEANPTRRISQLRAATRSARAVFLCSAPLVGQPNAGLTGQGLRLACAEPGDQLAIFGEALRELTERATYLYEEAGRYWFSTQPTLNRLADDRAKALADHDVDEAIADVLRKDAASKGGFDRVYAAPDDPVRIDEAQALALVVLAPASPHAGRGPSKSAATDAASDALMRCRSSQRRFRNTLVFVAADEAGLGTARDVMRKAMAWKQIVEDKRLHDAMTTAQIADAEDKARTNRDSAQKAVRSAWSHVLYSVKSDTAGKPFELEHSLISSRDRAAIPSVVYDKAKADGIALEKLGTERLWHALKPIWPEDREHLPVSELTDWFSSYVYLPKLRDRVVLETSIRDAVAKLDPQFGYADGYDETSGKYRGLIWAKDPPQPFPATAMLVSDAAAKRQLAEKAAAGQPAPAGAAAAAGGSPSPSDNPPAPTQPRKSRRFYGSVELDMVRPVKAFDAVLNAVVMELQRTQGAKVKLTLEIEAVADEGFSDNDVSVVRDNARQLKFKPESTGFEE
jgi:SNF2 domain-containing protein/uncharacterized protein DUF499